MALAALPGLGPINIRKLDRALEGAAERLLEMDARERAQWCPAGVVEELGDWKRTFDPEKVAGELERLDADFVTSEDPQYPSRLAPYADRPIGLYRCRSGADFGKRCIAIVGTRLPSGYGRRMARLFSTELCRLGFTIVSGMAEGIDTEAHRAALEAGGRTAAVLGGGLNRCYPASNRGLMAEIVESAGVWTEFPLWRSADRRSFPQRNRIVSAVSEAVVVVESGAKGGSLITARMASEQGKPVYVIPGRVDAPESAGCHALIRDGAQLVTCPGEILEDLNCFPEMLHTAMQRGAEQGLPARGRPEPELTGTEAEIWQLLDRHSPAHADALAGSLGKSIPEVAMALLELEMAGHIARRLDGCYERA